MPLIDRKFLDSLVDVRALLDGPFPLMSAKIVRMPPPVVLTDEDDVLSCLRALREVCG